MDKHSIIRITALLATLATLVIMLVGNTFSWYDRHPINYTTTVYNQLNYEKTGKINYSFGDCTTVTYQGQIKSGSLVYGTEPVSNTEEIEVTSDAPTYFKTVITNNDTSGDSVVSLYLTNIEWSSELGDTIHIGIMGPEKTYKSFTSTSTANYFTVGRTCIEDNIKLPKGETIEVIWYVKSDVNAGGTVTLGAQYPVYD